MTDAQTRIEDMKEWVHEHRREILCVVAGIAAAILIIGLTLTWFVSDRGHSTVGKVQAPATLKILGPNETATEQIDLTYDADEDTTAEDGTVTRKRAFCVKSGGESFELQVANTTNIDGLTIKVYRVGNTSASTADADVAGLDGLNQPYAWKKGSEVTGFTFINSGDATNTYAKEPTAPDPTFENYTTNVQKNARPLYRYKAFSQNDLDKGADGKPADATNFIIECTWNKDSAKNMKESDVVYLIARNIQASRAGE